MHKEHIFLVQQIMIPCTTNHDLLYKEFHPFGSPYKQGVAGGVFDRPYTEEAAGNFNEEFDYLTDPILIHGRFWSLPLYKMFVQHLAICRNL